MMDISNLCRCCGRNRAAMAICFKPAGTLHRIALCSRCFNHYHISADFLEKVLNHGAGADYRPFLELQEEIEVVNA